MIHKYLLVLLMTIACKNATEEGDATIKTFGNYKTVSSADSANLDTNQIEPLPAWYLRNRVQVLSSLPIKDVDKPFFFDFPVKLAQASATVLTREIKSGDEEPWWRSKYGTLNSKTSKYNEGTKNLASDIIKQAHDLNMRAIIYYRHMEDSEMLVKNPDWGCVNINGQILSTKRGKVLSLNSPYREVLIERVKELTTYGADGFYFDETHIPPSGDFSKYSKDLYKQQYGTDMVADFKAGKLLQFYNFRNNTMQRFFDDLRDTLKKTGKNPVLLVSGNSWPSLTDMHLSSEFFKNYTLKSELEVPNRRFKNRLFSMPENIISNIPSFYINAFAFSFMRDNSFGPPNIWCPQIKTEKEAEDICAGLISFGCIAEVDINQSAKRGELIVNFKEVLQWNKKFGNYFQTLTPYAVTGILASEKQRNKFIRTPDEAWTQVLLPAYDAFERMYKSGIPVKLVDDARLTKADLNQLSHVYCNASLPVPTSKNEFADKFADFKELNGLKGLELAVKTGSPIFCNKQNEFIHVNYFSDAKDYLYIITAPDFNSVKKNFAEKSKTNLLYTKNKGYNTSKKLEVFIKKQANIYDYLEDIVNSKKINPAREENGYSVFELDQNNISLGIYRFKSSLASH